MRALGIASSSGGTGTTPAVTITGNLTVGSVLTAAITAGYGGSLSYQWVRGADGASDLTGASNISGATSSTYTLVSGDMGRLIGCLVSGLTFQGRIAGVVAGVAPTVTTAPAIIGTPTVGTPTSFTTGTYGGTTPITKAVQWLLDGAELVGETGATYTPIEADEGKSLAIRETASNAWGSAVSTSSAAVIAAAGGGVATTITATGTQFLAAASASYRVTAGKLYLQATSGDNLSAFTFLVKGSDATMALENDASYYDGAVVVSVDGGAYGVATNVGSTYTLFAGLTDAWHKVSIKTGSIWGVNNLHLVPAAYVLSVTGVGAGWLAPSAWLHPGDVNSLIHTTGALGDNVTDYIPAKVMVRPYAAASNVGTIRFRSAATKLFLFANSDYPSAYVFYSRNGGVPVRVAVPANGTVIEGFDGTAATYNVWSNSGRYLSAGSDAAIVDVGTKKRMDQFGDSITAGDSGSGGAGQTNTPGDVDTLGVAANLGFAGATYGISGLTIEGMETAITPILAALPSAGASDVAVLAIGRNDVGSGFDATRQTRYNNIVDALVAKGYGRIVCRAVLPDSSSWDSFNTTMQSLVTARANPKVVYVPTSTWTGVSTSDGVHPDQAGYLTVRGYAITAYTPHIP